MARFGRSQPHAPIFLRAPLVAVAVVAATVSPIHVFQADAYRPPPTHVYYLRAPLRVVPADQIHVISLAVLRVQHPSRDADVLFLRTPAAPAAVVTTPAPQIHIVTALERAPTHGTVVVVRPSRASFVPDRLAPQFHIILQQHRTPPTHVVVLRNALVPVVVAAKPAPQIHVISLATERLPVIRRAAIVYLRPSRTSLVPTRLPVQVHVVSRVGDRIRVRREPMVVVLHGGQLFVAFTELGRPPYGVVLVGAPSASVSAVPGAELGQSGLNVSVSGAYGVAVSGGSGAELDRVFGGFFFDGVLAFDGLHFFIDP